MEIPNEITLEQLRTNPQLAELMTMNRRRSHETLSDWADRCRRNQVGAPCVPTSPDVPSVVEPGN